MNFSGFTSLINLVLVSIHPFDTILRGLRGIRGYLEFSQKYENSQFVGITLIDFIAKNRDFG